MPEIWTNGLSDIREPSHQAIRLTAENAVLPAVARGRIAANLEGVRDISVLCLVIEVRAFDRDGM